MPGPARRHAAGHDGLFLQSLSGTLALRERLIGLGFLITPQAFAS